MTILDMIGHKRTGTKLVDGVSHWNELRRGLKICRNKAKSAKTNFLQKLKKKLELKNLKNGKSVELKISAD